MEKPLVSICCICYNQEKYIRQTLDGFVMQQTTFPFEVVISDDCSKDGTRQIIAEYKNKYPKMFRDVSPEQNLGSITNFAHVQKEAKGKYVAICEGDDYWTDSLKLQKQVDFMEAHQEYSICFHSVQVYNEKKQQLEEDTITREVSETTDIYELANGNYMHTPSVMVRKSEDVLKRFEEMGVVMPGDYVLWMLYAIHGKIYKMKDEMAVYRFGSGIWTLNKTIKPDVEMLIALNKLWMIIGDVEVKEKLQQQILQETNIILDYAANLQRDLNTIRSSKAYRIGKMILAPFKWIKNDHRRYHINF